MLSEKYCCPRVLTLLLLIASLVGCSRLHKSAAVTAELPARDPRLQQWLESIWPASPPKGILQGQQAQTFAKKRTAAIVSILKARESGTLSDNAWLVGILQHLMSIQESGEYGWGVLLDLIDLSVWELGIEPETIRRTLEPYLTSTDPRVARGASEMIHWSQDYEKQQPENIATGRWTTSMKETVRSYAPADPPLSVVDSIYTKNPEMAMDAMAAVYLDGPARLKLARQRLELKRLILGYGLTTGEERKEMENQIEAKLTELSKHPHWSVRVYVLAVLTKAQSSASFRGDQWAKDSAVPTALLNDPNPYVRERAASSGGYYYIPDPKMRELFRGEIRN